MFNYTITKKPANVYYICRVVMIDANRVKLVSNFT